MRTFLLDANVLITAHQQYYGFDLCPGFWQAIVEGHAKARIFSTQRVENEIQKGKDRLANWVKSDLPPGFFLNDTSTGVMNAYQPMMAWVVAQKFLPAAQHKFASVADGWLTAICKDQGHVLVTLERKQVGAKARVPIPNVCEAFGVEYCDTFEMLRELGCSFR